MGKIRNNKAVSTILPYILILYLKQQSIILRCCYSLKFEKSFFSNKFFGFIFLSKMIVVAAVKDQIKYST